MSSIDVHTTLMQADWRACVNAWVARKRGAQTSWKSSFLWGIRRLKQPAAPEDVGIVLGPVTMRFDTAGVSVRQGLLHVVHAWSSVTEGTASPEHLFLWLDPSSVIIVPVRSLPHGMSVDEFRSRLDVMHESRQKREASDSELRHLPAPEMAPASLVNS